MNNSKVFLALSAGVLGLVGFVAAKSNRNSVPAYVKVGPADCLAIVAAPITSSCGNGIPAFTTSQHLLRIYTDPSCQNLAFSGEK